MQQIEYIKKVMKDVNHLNILNSNENIEVKL